MRPVPEKEPHTPPVLLFPAEDSLAVVRRRLEVYARRTVSAVLYSTRLHLQFRAHRDNYKRLGTGDLIVVNHWQHCHAPTVPFVTSISVSIFPKASPSAVGLIGAC